MTALLETAEVGSVYKYTGETTDTYENGALYVVKSTTVKLAQPTISIEETYVKGAAVENAKSYKLLKVVNDQYTDIGEQSIGKQTDGFTNGYVDSNGAFVNDENIGWKRTGFIHIDKLADVDGACVMLTPDSDSTINYCVANFYADDDAGTFVGGLTYSDMNSVGFTAADVVYYAESKNAKYVVFSCRWQGTGSLWVNLTDAIFFCLDEYADILTAGESHTLVVQAIGDGDNYEDSDYSNEVEHVVEEEAVTLISFTIDGTTYQAEEGMTYAEWVDSSYNTDGYYTSGNRLYSASGSQYGTSAGMSTSNVIEDGDVLYMTAGGA